MLQCQPCAFLINDTVLLDAGTVGSRLTLSEQRQITHVLLSHLHFDHIQGLPTLADNLAGVSGEPLVVAGLPEVLDGLQTHIFNAMVYPDFFRLPKPAHPVFTAHPLKPEQEWRVSGLSIVPVRVNHVVPTVGFLISDERTTILYSADTYQTEGLWRLAAAMPNLSAAFIEVSYPNSEAALAHKAQHLTPELMRGEFNKMRRPDLPVYAYHLKPRFRGLITDELQQLHLAHMTVLDENIELTI
jgi:ribonuclease BN (tRNA processing enzyme)